MLLAAVGTWALPTDFVEFPILTADELKAQYESKRFAIRCVQETSNCYNHFYTGNALKTALPLTADMVFMLELVDGSEDLFYLKKVYAPEDVAYLQTTNATTFGSKDASTVAKFSIIGVSMNGTDADITHYDKENSIFQGDTDDTNIGKLVRFVRSDADTYLNLNSGYANGKGVWSAQQIVDVTNYHQVTVNYIKEGETTSTTSFVKEGETITFPKHIGYTATAPSITIAEGPAVQSFNVLYTANVKTLIDNEYRIYYTDTDDNKHYLQTAGADNLTTVTENPLTYAVSNGMAGKYAKAYYLLMNNMRISNTAQNGSSIKTAPVTDSRQWTCQVFIEDTETGKCAIRLTNATAVDGWHAYYFIGKDADGNIIGVDPGATAPTDYYIWTVEPVHPTSDITYEFSDNMGNTLSGTVAGYPNDLSSVQTTVKGVDACLQNVQWSEDGTRVSATISYPFAVSTESTTNMLMIRSFKNKTNIFKWLAVGTSVKTLKNTEVSSENVANYLWAIYPSLADNALTFAIKNIATGKYIYSTATANSHDEGTVILSDIASKLTLESDNQLKLPTDLYLSVGTENSADQFIGAWGSTHEGSKNAFPTVSYTLTIGAAKAATLYTPIAVTVPTGLKAKYITAEGNEGAVAKQALKYTTLKAGSVIPAGAAVVVVSETEGTSTFTASTAEASELTGNLLFGYPTATPAAAHTGSGSEGTVYALTNNEGTAVFGHYVGANYRAGKAYLDVATLGAGANNVRYFHLFDDDVETGIDNIPGAEQPATNGAVYDLSGRRVNAAQHGIYIIGGKKVIK